MYESVVANHHAICYLCMCALTCFWYGKGAKYCDEYVCLSVCLLVRPHNSKTAQPNFTNLYACCLWPWLGHPLTALRYVMYFRYVSIPWVQLAESSTTSCLEEFARWRYQ